MDYLSIKALISSLVFAFLGIFILTCGFWLVDALTPHNLWREIIEKQNKALAILAGSFLLGLSIIVASAIH